MKNDEEVNLIEKSVDEPNEFAATKMADETLDIIISSSEDEDTLVSSGQNVVGSFKNIKARKNELKKIMVNIYMEDIALKF